MSDNAELKALVRRRMDATGEKYSTAYRALLRAAETEVLPMSGRRILPRIAASSQGSPADVYVQIVPKLNLDLDDDALAQYLDADESEREALVKQWLLDRLDQLFSDGEDLVDHWVVSNHQEFDDHVRWQADYLGVTPDQYLWLTDRLTTSEFEELSDDAMHQLLAAEYHDYTASDEK